ncbi:MAG: type II toxin-antitoxin system VapC family toxin [Scytonema sp. PMC 1069.18]|nr:type II toxin-antitoxin system VapC family toxin [Scytonema sp. PMC 1069.18]MEC4885360.1 type II toxin-antitoxin system VapC family toxin [Scytonema sp. PMC 1070.18]
MPEKLLIDTDVLIDYLRGKTPAIQYLENLTESLLVSSITIAELYAGVREGKERKALDEFVRAFEVVPVNDEIAIKGGLYRRDYFKSHNLGLADAIIAATSEMKNAYLVTLNQKHFPMLINVIVPYQKI